MDRARQTGEGGCKRPGSRMGSLVTTEKLLPKTQLLNLKSVKISSVSVTHARARQVCTIPLRYPLLVGTPRRQQAQRAQATHTDHALVSAGLIQEGTIKNPTRRARRRGCLPARARRIRSFRRHSTAGSASSSLSTYSSSSSYSSSSYASSWSPNRLCGSQIAG